MKDRLRLSILLLVIMACWAGCKSDSPGVESPDAGKTPVVENRDPMEGIFRVIEHLEEERSLGKGKLYRYLSDPDPRIRARASLAIGRIGNQEGLKYLATLLRDKSSQVRAAAILAVGLNQDDRHLERLLELTRNRDALTRQRAVEALGRIASPGGTSAVVSLLEDPDLGVACAAADACFRLRGGGVVEPLLEALKNGQPLLRFHAVNALDRLQVPPMDPVSNQPHDLEPDIRAAVKVAIPALLNAAGGEDSRVALAALNALARGGVVPENPTSLLKALKSDAPQVVVAALNAVRFLANEEAVQAHRMHLTHEDAHVRWAAVKGLATLHRVVNCAGEGAMKNDVETALEKILECDSVVQIRSDALAALAMIKGADALEDLEPYLKHPDYRIRSGLCKGAGNVGGARALSFLRLLLTDDDARVRMAAIRGQSMLGGGKEGQVEWIFRGLEDRVSGVRGQAAEVLRDLGDRRATGPLLKAYKDSGEKLSYATSEARFRIIQALTHLGGSQYTSLLDEALGDPSPVVRNNVIEFLKIMNGYLPEVVYKGPRTSQSRPVVKDKVLSDRPHIILFTNRGEIHLVLYPDLAPAHVKTFLALVENGFYNNKTFHRVVSNHVIQGGDPEGTGYGALEYCLPDEPSGETFKEGALGMAKLGRDTGSCQFFITLTPRPHLDGDYTVFGRVQEGMGVVKRIMIGDIITKAIWVKG